MIHDPNQSPTLQNHSRAMSVRPSTIAVPFLLAMALVLAACTSGTPSGTPASTASGGSAKADSIIIHNFVFSPRFSDCGARSHRDCHQQGSGDSHAYCHQGRVQYRRHSGWDFENVHGSEHAGNVSLYLLHSSIHERDVGCIGMSTGACHMQPHHTPFAIATQEKEERT